MSRPPKASSDAARKRMEATRQKDTATALVLRSALHRRGFRYKLEVPIPGTRRRIDIAFPRARVAVFVDGCFWHGCPEHRTWPRENSAWWREKLEANVARDRNTDEVLQRLGWSVVRIWEHEEPESAADLIAATLRRRSQSIR